MIISPEINQEKNISEEKIEQRINEYIKKGFSSNEAIKIVSKEAGLSKQEVYKKYHSWGVYENNSWFRKSWR